MNHDSLLGIVLIHQGVEALGPLPEPYKVGTLGRIVESETLRDGRLNITILGMDRFRILATSSADQPYLIGAIETSPFMSPNLLKVHRQSQVLARAVRQYLSGLHQVRMDSLDFSLFSPPDDPSSLVFLAAALLQIPPHEKQPILEEDSIQDMLEILERLYRRENSLMNAINNADNQSTRQTAWLN